MQFSTLISVILPMALVGKAAAQKSYCRAFDNTNLSNGACRGIEGVCTTACPRECGAGFALQSVNEAEGKCGCFCKK
ncbi:hypothetical protein BDP55DRAFT_734842 [Colletotrichum godetiae]|uniref:Uncharacterized protein n=1 Tax=Colletotrichum godetiae TaxID=1209918 RepID=A0AAJ0A6S0_9PEZI|nr:uncharacterized protein BDP55DRAFT_734842 [Colletotrichum godetiae]KAK1657564.1 hypothetical protein BDP55DRAFT_734842 [Colletotrichum godetiae]